jgi:hypothetical protein
MPDAHRAQPSGKPVNKRKDFPTVRPATHPAEEVWVNDVFEVEVVDGEIRVVLCCTRMGVQVPKVALVGPVAKLPEIVAKIIEAAQKAPQPLPN